MRTIVLVMALAFLSGCASMEITDREQKRYERLEFRAHFIDYRSTCFRKGGRIIIQALGKVGRDGVPKPGDRYACL